MKYLVILYSFFIVSIPIYGQGNFTLSMPVIYSKVELPNNWSPPTAINRENKFNGTALGYGANVNYSFRPTTLIKNKHILMNIGVGYFTQRFNLKRPFDYDAPVQPIFYTNYYSYHCLQGLIGLAYNHSLSKNYFLTGNLSYKIGRAHV